MNTNVDFEGLTSHTSVLRRMDVIPPSYEGDIDGIKSNSFQLPVWIALPTKWIRFSIARASYLSRAKSERSKNVLVWYERYMADNDSVKLWSVMKQNMNIEFREPNFSEKIRNKILTVKQIGSYHGYVMRLRELQRIIRLDNLTAMNCCWMAWVTFRWNVRYNGSNQCVSMIQFKRVFLNVNCTASLYCQRSL